MKNGKYDWYTTADFLVAFSLIHLHIFSFYATFFFMKTSLKIRIRQCFSVDRNEKKKKLKKMFNKNVTRLNEGFHFILFFFFYIYCFCLSLIVFLSVLMHVISVYQIEEKMIMSLSVSFVLFHIFSAEEEKKTAKSNMH